MLSHRKWLHFFAIIGLLLGQWCAVVHASQHDELASPDKAPCPICAIAHAAGITPSAVQLPATPVPLAERGTLVVPASPLVRRSAPPQSRAPPAFPA